MDYHIRLNIFKELLVSSGHFSPLFPQRTHYVNIKTPRHNAIESVTVIHSIEFHMVLLSNLSHAMSTFFKSMKEFQVPCFSFTEQGIPSAIQETQLFQDFHSVSRLRWLRNFLPFALDRLHSGLAVIQQPLEKLRREQSSTSLVRNIAIMQK